MLRARVRATAAAAKVFAIRRKEKVNVCRASIFCQSTGMKFALGSGVGHAANARKRASSFSSLLPRIGVIPFFPRPILTGLPGLLTIRRSKGLQNPLPGPEEPNLKSIFV